MCEEARVGLGNCSATPVSRVQFRTSDAAERDTVSLRNNENVGRARSTTILRCPTYIYVCLGFIPVTGGIALFLGHFLNGRLPRDGLFFGSWDLAFSSS